MEAGQRNRGKVAFEKLEQLAARLSLLNLFGVDTRNGSWDYSERRGKLRCKCHVDVDVIHEDNRMAAQARDVSAGGMQLACQGDLESGAEISVGGARFGRQDNAHPLRCVVRWARKEPCGSVVGVEFLGEPERIAQSWLIWELHDQNVRLARALQRRRQVRTKCVIPAHLSFQGQKFEANVVNLSPSGAGVQVEGERLTPGEKVTLTFVSRHRLPKIVVIARVVNSTEGSPTTYGIEFDKFKSGSVKGIKRYLDFLRSRR